MILGVKRKDLYEKAYAYANREDDDYLAKEFMKNINSYLKDLLVLLNKDISSLSDKEYNVLINSIYSIYFEDEDILSVLSIAYNNCYDFSWCVLNTNMVIEGTIKEGKGSSFSWEKEYGQISYRVACSKYSMPNTERNYTLQEIQQLVKERRIVLLERFTKDCEKFPGHQIVKDPYLPTHKYCYKSPEMLSSFVQYFKSKVPEEKLIADIKTYLNALTDEIRMVTDGILSTEIGTYAKKYYEQSDAKQSMLLLNKRLNK